MRNINIKIKTEDNFTLDGIFTAVKGSTKGIIFAHGMTVDKDDEGIFVRAEPKLNELGFSTLRFDFRAHGKSQGNPVNDFTISGEIRDLEATVNFIQEQGINWLGLAGASVGGSISALYLGKYPNTFSKVFLANPTLNYEKCFLDPTTPWAREHFENVFEQLGEKGFIEVGSRKSKVGKVFFEKMKLYNPCVRLKKYNSPLMIVHGDQDTKIAYQDVIECFENLPNPKKQLKILKGAEHGFHSEPYESQVVEIIVSFFSQS